MPIRGLVVALGAVLCIGCLDPLEEDTPGYGAHLLPPGTVIPDSMDDPLLVMQIDRNDGLPTKIVPRLTGFADNETVFFWDFGPGVRTVGPIFRFFTRTSPPGADEEVLEPADHENLIDTIPGDATYSPFRGKFDVVFTDKWRGEIISSMEALQDALEVGIIEEPRSLLHYENNPVVLADQQIEVARDGAGMPEYQRPGGRAICNGTLYHYFEITGEYESGVSSRPSNVHVLTRDGDSLPLAEQSRPADLNGDGDALDTNYVFAVGPANVMYYSNLSLVVNTIVPPTYSWAQFNAETDMFDVMVSMMGRTIVWRLTKKQGTIVGFTVTTALRNLPIQRQSGRP